MTEMHGTLPELRTQLRTDYPWMRYVPDDELDALILAARNESPTPENSPHDYEPSDPPMYSGGYTDPLCRVCGQPKPARVHR